MTKRHVPLFGRSADVELIHTFVGDDQLVGRLVCLADDGPEIPVAGAGMVKDAIRPLWRHEVRLRARSRRRKLIWAGSLAAAAAVVIAFGLVTRVGQRGPVTASSHVATVALVVGSLEVVAPDGGSLTPVAPGDTGVEVAAGSELRTDSVTRVALEMAGGQSLRLDTDSSIRLLSDRSLFLDRGAVYVDSGRNGAKGIEVHTGIGVATDVGTQFEVRQSAKEMVVRVREGKVMLDRDGDELEVGQGSQITVGADGSVVLQEVRSYGPVWSWVQEAAPAFVMEGRSVVDFLGWVSRETGLWIRFADPETELLATETRLHGALEGLTPLQAPGVVLPGCGLSPRFGAETLVVERLGGK